MTKMLQSKKFIASILAAILGLGGFYLGMSTEQIAVITGPLMIYIGAQGLADIGKEAKLTEAAIKEYNNAPTNRD
jgi:hypothetical protein